MHLARFLATLSLCLLSAVTQATTQVTACQNMVRMTDLSYAVEPGAVIPATPTIPSHCRVRAVINRAIQVEVRLPLTEWNGRFMFSTVGGGAGSIGDTTSLLARGFAMASTDTGHEGQTMDFVTQPEALIDYAYRGVHLATQFSKLVVERFFGRSIDFSYLQGCSNGGRAALMEAQRFPTDYDGIIAGAPAFRFQEFAPWMIQGARLQDKGPLTQASLQLLDDASRAACDTLDGVGDGIINDPRQCTTDHFNIDTLACNEGQNDPCLSDAQLETARFMYSDVYNDAGQLVSPGVLPGAEGAGDWGFWILPNDLLGADSIIGGMANTVGMLMRRDLTFDVTNFDPRNDRNVMNGIAPVLDIQNADLKEFRDHGGKLLIYQGWNDYPLRPQRAIDFLLEANALHGGQRKTSRFFRLFMVPGMVHCAGGPGAWQTDYVEPLMAWREQGRAPRRIIGTHPKDTDMAHLAANPNSSGDRASFSRPQCVYPKLAQYDGRGDSNDAASFRCVD